MDQSHQISTVINDVKLINKREELGIILHSIKNTIVTLDEDLDIGEFRLEYLNEKEDVVLFKNVNKIYKLDTVYICTLSGHRLKIFIQR